MTPGHAENADEFAEALRRREEELTRLRAVEESAELGAAHRLLPPGDSRECVDLGDDSGRWEQLGGWTLGPTLDACFFGGLLLALVGVLVVVPRLMK